MTDQEILKMRVELAGNKIRLDQSFITLQRSLKNLTKMSYLFGGLCIVFTAASIYDIHIRMQAERVLDSNEVKINKLEAKLDSLMKTR